MCVNRLSVTTDLTKRLSWKSCQDKSQYHSIVVLQQRDTAEQTYPCLSARDGSLLCPAVYHLVVGFEAAAPGELQPPKYECHALSAPHLANSFWTSAVHCLYWAGDVQWLLPATGRGIAHSGLRLYDQDGRPSPPRTEHQADTASVAPPPPHCPGRPKAPFPLRAVLV